MTNQLRWLGGWITVDRLVDSEGRIKAEIYRHNGTWYLVGWTYTTRDEDEIRRIAERTV